MDRITRGAVSFCSVMVTAFAILALLAGPVDIAKADPPPPPPLPPGCGSWGANGCIPNQQATCLASGQGVGGCATIIVQGGNTCHCVWGLDGNWGGNPVWRCGCFLN